MGTECCDKQPLVPATEDGFFWAPNRLVDLGEALRPQGVYLYCCIARCRTLAAYPATADLVAKTGMPTTRVDNLLDRLAKFGLLNVTDLTRIRRD